MTETTEQQSSLTSTWAWTFQVLGVLLGTATCISLVKNFGSIELYGMPAKVFAQYTWMRDTLFEPVAWAFRYLGLTLPWLAKDLTFVYLLVGGAYFRGMLAFWQRSARKAKLSKRQYYNFRPYWLGPTLVLTWPYRLAKLLLEMRAYLVTTLVLRAPGRAFVDSHTPWIKSQLWFVATNVLVIAIATLGLFIWNALTASVGPG